MHGSGMLKTFNNEEISKQHIKFELFWKTDVPFVQRQNLTLNLHNFVNPCHLLNLTPVA